MSFVMRKNDRGVCLYPTNHRLLGDVCIEFRPKLNCWDAVRYGNGMCMAQRRLSGTTYRCDSLLDAAAFLLGNGVLHHRAQKVRQPC